MKTLITSILLIVIVGCAQSSSSTMSESEFAAMGGKQTLSKVFGLALSRIYNDPTIGHHFNGVPKRHIRKHLTDQTCALLGGPCTYTGKTMVEVHTGHQIKDQEFFILVEYVQGAMRDIGMSTEHENAILKVLAPLKSDIVNL